MKTEIAEVVVESGKNIRGRIEGAMASHATKTTPVVQGVIKDLIGGISFNSRILPEILITGSIILAIVLSNQVVLLMAIGSILTLLLTSTIGQILMKMVTGTATGTSSMNTCYSGFGGKSWLRLTTTHNPELSWHPYAPSMYMSVIGYFFGYGLALWTIYKDEINSGIINKSIPITLVTVSACVILFTLLQRYMSGCDSIVTALLGVFIGSMCGYAGTICLGMTTERKATNLWGIPLLRNRKYTIQKQKVTH